ncbi:GNAT family N-acetyltransferase [Svornostia abyssi]|uniref:GNAT family N-acetyltransferase n=1 Tax=Svornostia abyssi TaxID=2898438 RepID=A0ABY5PIR8_9ACTN|nr:GNAT family N-acetyltransferase [Parviterribacteraceae bacterium J379]
MTVEIREPANGDELRAAFDLRYEVFCNEQGVPLELELDEHDADALHLVAVEDGEVVATCRLLRVGDTVKFGRLVVAQRARRRGIAADMLAETERRARELRARRLVLSAQTYAVKLYEDAGYVAFGDTYDDAGIEHISMERELA